MRSFSTPIGVLKVLLLIADISQGISSSINVFSKIDQNTYEVEQLWIIPVNLSVALQENSKNVCDEKGMELVSLHLTSDNLEAVINAKPSSNSYASNNNVSNENSETQGATIWIYMDKSQSNNSTVYESDDDSASVEIAASAWNDAKRELAVYFYNSLSDSKQFIKICICLFDDSKSYWCQGTNCTLKNGILCRKRIVHASSNATEANGQTFWRLFWMGVAAAIVIFNLGLLITWLIHKKCAKTRQVLYF